MKVRAKRSFTGCTMRFFVVLVMLQGMAATVWASEIKDLLNQVNKELRQAQRDMFGGKTEKAVAALPSIREKLIQAKQADPDLTQTATYENKYKKLVKDLERRTGRDLGGGTLTASGTSTQTELPRKPEVQATPEMQTAVPAPAAEEKLPYAARRPVRDAENDLARIDSALQRLEDPNWNKHQLLENMKKYLQSARDNVETGKAEAAKKGVNSHPDFDRIETGLREAEQKIADASEKMERADIEAAAEKKEVTADVEALRALYDRCEPLFNKATGSVIYYNDLEPVKALITEIEAFEKNQLDAVRRQLKAFGDKYGTTSDAIDQKADAMGYENNYYRASFAFTELTKGIADVSKTRGAMAEDLVQKAEEMKTRSNQGIHDFARFKQHSRIRSQGKMAERFDPENPAVKAFNSKIDAWIAADTGALNAKIDQAVFPEQADDSPKNAKKLTKEAHKFLQKEEDERAIEKGLEVSKVLAVVITGPWRVFKRNILGEPVQYNLPIATAVQTETEKTQNLARVYLSTLLTHEMKGVETGPPFLGATVGDSYYIRPAAVK